MLWILARNHDLNKGQSAINTSVDKSKIALPKLTLSGAAKAQLILMYREDFTIEGQVFRVSVDGKGCDGFTYTTGFTARKQDDFLIVVDEELDLFLAIDPFSAFYLQEFELDFVQDFENNQEGFLVINHQQTQFHGKFWKDQEELIPPQKLKS